MKANLLHMILAIVVVVVIGVTMAVTGFSRDTFMGLVLLAAAVGLVVPNIKNVQSPPPGTGRGPWVSGARSEASAPRPVSCWAES